MSPVRYPAFCSARANDRLLVAVAVVGVVPAVRAGVGEDAVVVGVLAGEDRRPGRAAQRVGHVVPRHRLAGLLQRHDVRHVRGEVPRQVVGEDEHDVRLRARGRAGAGSGGGARGHEQGHDDGTDAEGSTFRDPMVAPPCWRGVRAPYEGCQSLDRRAARALPRRRRGPRIRRHERRGRRSGQRGPGTRRHTPAPGRRARRRARPGRAARRRPPRRADSTPTARTRTRPG